MHLFGNCRKFWKYAAFCRPQRHFFKKPGFYSRSHFDFDAVTVRSIDRCTGNLSASVYNGHGGVVAVSIISICICQDIGIVVIGIADAEGFLKKLDSVKINGIGIEGRFCYPLAFWGALLYYISKNAPKGGLAAENTYSQIQERLHQQADSQVRLNLISYDGTPEI